MNILEEENVLNKKLNIIEQETRKQTEKYNILYTKTIEKREELQRQRSALKTNEVVSELARINKNISRCNRIATKLRKLKISHKSPYFACITFDGEDYYIGKLGVKEEDGGNIVVFDWRAPIASLFYDFEIGPAYYIVPNVCKIEGEITGKKQYKIENSKFVYAFETNVNVEDELLQKTLAENSSANMKTIVASIQKEQNQIIRMPKDQTFVVQGAFGSGKTSIALHRIAYLLYNNKKQLKSNNVLIFSPNKVFASYISTVLPELGESRAKESTIDEMLEENFGGIFEFYTKFENIEMILHSEEFYEIHKRKTSLEFFDNLNEFLREQSAKSFEPKLLKVKKIEFDEEQIAKMFSFTSEKTLIEEISLVASRIIDIVNVRSPLSLEEENSIKNIIKVKLLKCFNKSFKNILRTYSKFLKTQNIEFKLKKKLYFDDAVALLYIKNYIFGADQNKIINHIVIDELQDLSPLALSIIAATYPCTKTALGDIYQTVDQTPNAQILERTCKILGAESAPITLSTCYRSTKQIATFARDILGLKNLKIINRSGSDVEIIKTENLFEELENKVAALKQKYKLIAIITKTYKEAFEIGKKIGAKIMSPISQKYKTGLVVAPAYLTKGLEFDCAIVCDANSENFKTELDKQQLYVACTRPLHHLSIIHTNTLTKLIKQKKN